MMQLTRCDCTRSGLIISLATLFVAVQVLFLTSVQEVDAQTRDSNVRAELSASAITRDESVLLTITAQGVNAEPDTAALNEDFDVVSNSTSREVRATLNSSGEIVNVSIVRWALELSPKGQGVFTVPAIKVGDYETQLLTLTVNEAPQGANRDVFIETRVDTTTPWVQSQVILTLKVFLGVDIVDGGIDVPSGDDLVFESLGEDTQRREQRDGREYSVTERRFAVFPQKSGTAVIDPVTLNVSVPAQPDRVRGFFSRTKKLTRRSDPITLKVQARPPENASWWLPASNLNLEGRWQGNPEAAQVDQPLTRTLIMQVDGVLESQLPAINVPAIEGLSLYAEQPVLNTETSVAGIRSEQRINCLLYTSPSPRDRG